MTPQQGTKPIFLYVSETGLSADGTTIFTTGLTENLLPAGWEVDEWAYATEGDTPFTTAGTLLGTHDFTAIGTSTTSKTLTLTTPYTVTEIFEIIPGGVKTVLGRGRLRLYRSGAFDLGDDAFFFGLGYAAFRRTPKGRQMVAGI